MKNTVDFQKAVGKIQSLGSDSSIGSKYTVLVRRSFVNLSVFGKVILKYAYVKEIILCNVESPGSKSKPKLYYDRQSVGQSILVPGTHLGPETNFYFSLKFSLGGFDIS
jgi:hypothetical protein